ncbi:amino acid adenylation domain-containing protein [Streptomyces lunalinharesii]|uniref:Amino acid adenylation domain-containing protein n=1 Tax=Streptomyces lunalinharesii TaxID=333384 RepID=A0ABN3RUB6_9ACTN
MSEDNCPAAGVWLVDGDVDVRALRARLAADRAPLRLTLQDLTAGGADEAVRGQLVREEAAAARAEPGYARALLARLAADRFLVVVVTARPLPPDAVLRWLLGAGTPFPGAARDADAPTAPRTELPSALRTGDTPSGTAATLYRAAGPVAARLRATGVPAGAALAGALALLLVRYGGGPETGVLLDGPVPSAVLLRVDEAATGADLLRRAVAAAGAGTPVDPLGRAALAVAADRPPEPERFGDRTAVPVRVADGAGRHDLLALLEGDRLRVDYDTGLFGEEAVEAFAGRLLAVLDALLDGAPVHDVTGATGDERAALDRWSRGPDRPVADVCLHTLVEHSAARTPDAVAVVCGATELTYRALDLAANRLAHRLRAAGIGPGDRVALLAERSAESVVAMLGVLKSGAAYVPIEPAHPADRIRHIVTDSGAGALLAHRPPDLSLPVPVLLTSGTAAEPTHAPEVPVTPDDTAYVIYTSGSTGTPKGIAVHHRALVVSTAARDAAGPAPGRDLVLPPLCFDGAAGGLYWALASGGAVVLPTEAEAHDPLALRALLDRAGITHLHAVPSHYQVLLQIADERALSRLVLVAVGGEPLAPDVVAEHLRGCPGAVLLNDYGPTECAVWATTHRCGPAEAAGAPIPIGRPVPNYRAHVLDSGLRPAPPGVPGEIYLGGPAVALGYHGRPGLTAERFLPDPFAPGGRLYRTGDRGLWSADGRLRILGRVDHQVKVRGFRIELGEVETAVRRHPAVAECAVLLRRSDAGDRLCAFVVPAGGGAGGALRRDIAEVLPDYMCPDHFVVLPALPRTPGGKLDAHALRAVPLPGLREVR